MKHLTVVALMAVLVLCLIGCGLSPEQQAALREYDAEITETRARLMEYEPQVREVVNAIARDDIPIAEATRLLEKIEVNYESDRTQLAELRAKAEELDALNVPWWLALLPILSLGVGAGAGLWKGAAKYGPLLDVAHRMLRVTILGVEASGAKDAPPVKMCIKDRARSDGVENELHREVDRYTK